MPSQDRLLSLCELQESLFLPVPCSTFHFTNQVALKYSRYGLRIPSTLPLTRTGRTDESYSFRKVSHSIRLCIISELPPCKDSTCNYFMRCGTVSLNKGGLLAVSHAELCNVLYTYARPRLPLGINSEQLKEISTTV